MSFFKLINEESLTKTPFNILVGCRTNRPRPYSVTSFDQLKSITVPNADMLATDILLAFEKNYVHWKPNMDFGVVWPDNLLATKEGCCFDFAILMHYLFEHHGIENSLGFIKFVNPHGLPKQIGHVVPIFKDERGLYWIWNYFGFDNHTGAAYSDINGPWEDINHLEYEIPKYFAVLYNSVIRFPETNSIKIPFINTLSGKDLSFIDKAWAKNEKITNGALLRRYKKASLLEAAKQKDSDEIAFIRPKEEDIKLFLRKMKNKSMFRKGGLLD